MKDEEFIFRQEVREKKRIGAGAFHKKNGSKSKKCTLPSDRLTRKEKEKLNGECKSWNLKAFYSWDEFKRMPSDIQLEYVNSLINRYDCGLTTISKILFEKAPSTLSFHMKSRGLLDYVNNKNRASTHGAERLEQAIKEAKNPPKPLEYQHSDTTPVAKVESIKETDQGLEVKAKSIYYDPVSGKYFYSDPDKVRKMADELADTSLHMDSDTLRALSYVKSIVPEYVNSETKVSDFLIRMDRFDDDIWEFIKGLYFMEDDLQITISVAKGS